MTARIGDWSQTFRGIRMYPLDPRPDEIDIADIAHSLSMQCRFNGHTRHFLSVAEHCCFVHDLLPAEWRLCGLLHDASEAYLSDVPRPIKQTAEFGPAYRAAEDALMQVIAAKFEFVYPIPDVVVRVDHAICRTEAVQLMAPVLEWSDGAQPISGLKLHCWAPVQAEHEFLHRYLALPPMRENPDRPWTAEEINRRAG